jgi:hypothetical protein
MTSQTSTAAGQPELDAARLLLARMGISPADLLHGASTRPPAPTFTEYVPIVSDAVSDSSRRAYSSYWKKIVMHWGERRLDEPTPPSQPSPANRIHSPQRRMCWPSSAAVGMREMTNTTGAVSPIRRTRRWPTSHANQQPSPLRPGSTNHSKQTEDTQAIQSTSR